MKSSPFCPNSFRARSNSFQASTSVAVKSLAVSRIEIAEASCASAVSSRCACKAAEVPEIKQLVDNPPDWLEEWSGQIGAPLEDGLRENPTWIARSSARSTKSW